MLYEKKTILVFFTCIPILLVPLPTFPCTTFFINNDNKAVFGKNYDWDIDDGYVIVNRRNMKKQAFRQDNPVEWTSRYGSVSFIQYGMEFPTGGMNEKGLVIETMWEDMQEYPGPDDRRSIDNMQWIQYQLDTYSSIKDVVASLDTVNIRPVSMAKVHYLLADRDGNCASIDFIDGKAAVFVNKEMDLYALANHTYRESKRQLSRYRTSDGSIDPGKGSGSIDRFIRAGSAAAMYKQEIHGNPRQYAFEILQSVSAGSYTMWSIVYDLKSLTVHFKTHTRRKIKTIEIGKIDYSCKSPMLSLEVNNSCYGNCLKKMKKFTLKENSRLISTTFRKTWFLQAINRELYDAFVAYPSLCVCGE